MYALMANTGQAEGTPAPSLVLPNLQSTALIAGERPLAGKRAGVCWKVRPGSPAATPSAQQAVLC